MKYVVGAALLASAVPADVIAHDPDAESWFFRDRNASVLGRTRPDYASEGIQRGAWIFDPEIRFGVTHTDNVFAASSNEESDTILSFNPSLEVETTWQRHGIYARANALRTEYDKFGEESTWNTELYARGHVDVATLTKLEAGGGIASLTEPRTAAGAANIAAEPVEYDTSSWFVAAEREMGRFWVQGRYDAATFNFDDAPAIGGGFLDQDFRDRDESAFTVRGAYAVNEDTAVFARVRWNERKYDLQPPAVSRDRSSSGYMIDFGADFDIGGVARGIVGFGYNQQEYDDPAFGELEGWGADALVEWFPTQLTTVTFGISRTIEDSPIQGSGGFTAEEYMVRVDHELRRNVILSAGIELDRDDFLNIDREDDRWTAEASATWLVNRRVGAEAWIARTDQDSQGAFGGQDYEVTAAGLRLVLRP